MRDFFPVDDRFPKMSNNLKLTFKENVLTARLSPYLKLAKRPLPWTLVQFTESAKNRVIKYFPPSKVVWIELRL